MMMMFGPSLDELSYGGGVGNSGCVSGATGTTTVELDCCRASDTEKPTGDRYDTRLSDPDGLKRVAMTSETRPDMGNISSSSCTSTASVMTIACALVVLLLLPAPDCCRRRRDSGVLVTEGDRVYDVLTDGEALSDSVAEAVLDSETEDDVVTVNDEVTVSDVVTVNDDVGEAEMEADVESDSVFDAEIEADVVSDGVFDVDMLTEGERDGREADTVTLGDRDCATDSDGVNDGDAENDGELVDDGDAVNVEDDVKEAVDVSEADVETEGDWVSLDVAVGDSTNVVDAVADVEADSDGDVSRASSDSTDSRMTASALTIIPVALHAATTMRRTAARTLSRSNAQRVPIVENVSSNCT